MAESIGAALAELGTRASRLADKDDPSSIALFDELVRRIQQLPDSPQASKGLAQALFYRGRAYSSVTAVLDLDRAAADLKRARRLFALFSDARHEAECLGQLGVVEVKRYENEVRAGGHRGRASQAYREAERFWKESLTLSHDPAALNTTLGNLAQLYSIGGEWPLAQESYSELLTASETRGDAHTAAQASLGVALSLASMGRRRPARRAVRETMRRAEAIGPGAEDVARGAARLLRQLQ